MIQHQKTEFIVEKWLDDSNKVVGLDPLGFDDKLGLLHLMNKRNDTREIIQLLYRSLPNPDILDSFSYEESLAAMRDLGIFIGTLKKHGIEPVEVVPELEYVLLVLMVKTDLPPRDTLLHYTTWNPSDTRIRTYTGLTDEISLIESVRKAIPGLMRSIAQLEMLHERPLHGHEFGVICKDVKEMMEGMVEGIVHAKRCVSPAVFANELRFYYDPIKVDYNKDYIGPGAVEMPMFVFDHLLWSSDCEDEAYSSFKEGYLPYNMSFIRDIYWRFDRTPSLLTRVEQNLRDERSDEHFRAALSVLELCSVLKRFRMPHKKVAEAAYSQGEEQYHDKGSGGYSTNILLHIIALQNERIKALQDVVGKVQVKNI